jgi:hypothetical protein
MTKTSRKPLCNVLIQIVKAISKDNNSALNKGLRIVNAILIDNRNIMNIQNKYFNMSAALIIIPITAKVAINRPNSPERKNADLLK